MKWLVLGVPFASIVTIVPPDDLSNKAKKLSLFRMRHHNTHLGTKNTLTTTERQY